MPCLDELCICGHTLEEHFGGKHCSHVSKWREPWTDCDCDQFVEIGFSLPLFRKLREIARLAPESEDAKRIVALAGALVTEAEKSAVEEEIL